MKTYFSHCYDKPFQRKYKTFYQKKPTIKTYYSGFISNFFVNAETNWKPACPTGGFILAPVQLKPQHSELCCVIGFSTTGTSASRNCERQYSRTELSVHFGNLPHEGDSLRNLASVLFGFN